MRNYQCNSCIRVLCHSIIALISCWTVAASRAADPEFRILLDRSGDQVSIKFHEDKTVFVITSPTGIGKATIKRLDAKWPDPVWLELQLRGLEKLTIVSGQEKLQAAVSSTDAVSRICLEGKESETLDPESPYWMEIDALDSSGEKTTAIPLIDGSFRMQVPKKLFSPTPESITFEWIDFYR